MNINNNTTTMVLEGRRIDITGNIAQIMDLDDTEIVATMQAKDAAGLIRAVQGWLQAHTTKK